MARRSRSSKSRTRDTSRIANPRLRFSYPIRSAYLFPELTRVEDFRRFYPVGIDNVSRTLRSFRSPIALSRPRTHTSYPSRLPSRKAFFSFSDPRRVIICVRRKIRKEVLHALRKSGRSGQRRPRRTTYSNIRCGG